jgi:hypothetical protein
MSKDLIIGGDDSRKVFGKPRHKVPSLKEQVGYASTEPPKEQTMKLSDVAKLVEAARKEERQKMVKRLKKYRNYYWIDQSEFEALLKEGEGK